MRDEIFGPILPVLTYTRLDEALQYINAHDKPLALYLFTNSRWACRVRHSVAIYGQRLLVCDQSLREKAWCSRKREA